MSNAKVRARRRRRANGTAGTLPAIRGRVCFYDVETATIQLGATDPFRALADVLWPTNPYNVALDDLLRRVAATP